jgi:hypothetical protein
MVESTQVKKAVSKNRGVSMIKLNYHCLQHTKQIHFLQENLPTQSGAPGSDPPRIARDPPRIARKTSGHFCITYEYNLRTF